MSYKPPLPAHPVIQVFNSTSIIGLRPQRDDALEDAAIDFWHAFNPRPIRTLKKEDLHSASKALEVWEQSIQAGIPNLTDLRASLLSFLTLDMLQALRHVAMIAKMPGTAGKPLKSRIRALIRDIFSKILQEKRSKTRARDLLTDLSERIGAHFLRSGEHSIHWATVELPFIVDLLEVWPLSELPSDTLDTGILGDLHAIYQSPCLPIATVSQNLRMRAFDLCRNWSMTLSISSTNQALDFTPDTIEWQFYDVGTLAQVLQILEMSAAAADPKNVRLALQKLQHWRNIYMDLDLVFSIRETFSKVYKSLRETRTQWRPVELNQIRLQMKLISVEDLKFDFPQFYSLRPPTAASKVFLGPPTSPVGTIVTFIKVPFGGHSYEYTTQGHDKDITFTCLSLDIPAQVLFDIFIAEWNKYNRHPLWPLFTFDLQYICKLTTSYWCQGSLSSVLQSIRPSSSGVFEIQYRVIRNDRFEEKRSHQVSMLLAWERIVGCVSPSSWITPSPPTRTTSWMQVPTLSFVGSGSEIHPYITYPPIITSYIWVPKQWEELGLNPRHLTQHNPCSKISVISRISLENGAFLSREEALSLVGRTVQFAIKVPVNGMIMDRYDESRLSLSRSAADHVVQIFVSFIWGFDPERMILRGLERDNTERCRSFFIGNERRFPVVDDRIAWRNANRNEFEPVRPLWIGAVETRGGQ